MMDKTPDTIEIDSTLIRKISPSCSALSEKVTFDSGGKAYVETEDLNTHECVKRETDLPPGLFQLMLSLIGTISPMDGDFSEGTWIITLSSGGEVISSIKGPIGRDNGLGLFSRTYRDLLGLKTLIALDGEFSQAELSSFTINYEDDDGYEEKAILEARTRDLRLYRKRFDGKESYVQLTLSPWQLGYIRESADADLFLRSAKPGRAKGFARISFNLNFEDGSAITHSSDMLLGILPDGYVRFLDEISTAVSDTSFMLMFSRSPLMRERDDCLFVKAVFSDSSSKRYAYMIRDGRVWEDSSVIVPAGNDVVTVKVDEVITASLSEPPYPLHRIRVAFGLNGFVEMITSPPFSADDALRHLVNMSSIGNDTPFIPDAVSKALSHLMATDLMVYVPTEPGVTDDNFYLLSGDGMAILPCFLSEEDDRMDVIAGHMLMSFHDYLRTIREHREFTGGSIDPFGTPVLFSRILVEDAFSEVATSSFFTVKGEINTDLYIMIKGKKCALECERRLNLTLSEGFNEAGGRLFLIIAEKNVTNGKKIFSLMKEAVKRGVLSVMIFEKDFGNVLSGMLSAFTSYYREVYLDVFIKTGK